MFELLHIQASAHMIRIYNLDVPITVYVTRNNSCTRVESESDDLDYLGHLGHFLVGQVGLIRKLNYLDVTRIFNR